MKRSILLLQNIIYGAAPSPCPHDFYVFPDLTASVENAWLTPWRANVPYSCLAVDHNISGAITHNEPIDVISWSAGPGEIKLTGMEIWEQCMTLFMRHI